MVKYHIYPMAKISNTGILSSKPVIFANLIESTFNQGGITMETKVREKMINGVDVEALFKTINLIETNPEIAKFKFRARNKWQDGTHNRATIKDFYGALSEDDSREPVDYDLDEPPVLLGKNLGSNPVEYLLVALSGCITTAIVAHASAEGIALEGIESRLEGDIDLRGFLGISDDVPVGYQGIRIYFKIDANIPQEKKEELVQMGQKYSPVFNTISHATKVSAFLD
jgi:uncharacterized OsmC-like protein